MLTFRLEENGGKAALQFVFSGFCTRFMAVSPSPLAVFSRQNSKRGPWTCTPSTGVPADCSVLLSRSMETCGPHCRGKTATLECRKVLKSEEKLQDQS